MSTGVIRLSADKRCKRSRACCSTAMTNASCTVLHSSPARTRSSHCNKSQESLRPIIVQLAHTITHTQHAINYKQPVIRESTLGELIKTPTKYLHRRTSSNGLNSEKSMDNSQLNNKRIWAERLCMRYRISYSRDVVFFFRLLREIFSRI